MHTYSYLQFDIKEMTTPIITTTISNKGEYAQINVAAVILDKDKKPLYSFATKKVMLDKDETTELSFVCDFIELNNGKHYLNLQYYNPFDGTQKWKMLTPTTRNLLAFTISNDESNAIENTEETGIIVFPSHAKDFINITAEEEIKNVTIYSVTGIKIASIEPNSDLATIDVQNFEKGIYLLVIETTKNKQTIKINKI